MMIFKLRLEFKKIGSLLDAEVILEGSHRVGLWPYDSVKKVFFSDLPNYSIDDEKLLVSFAVEGKSGAKGELEIFVNDKSIKKMTCTVPDGYNTDLKKEDILIPDKKDTVASAAKVDAPAAGGEN
jgi:hypothetical protein